MLWVFLICARVAKRQEGNLSPSIHLTQLPCLLSASRFEPRKTNLAVLCESVSETCAVGSAGLIMCYLWCYKRRKTNCFSTFGVKLVSVRRRVSEADDGWWHTDQCYSLEQTSAAEGAVRPQRCLSALWYTLGERGCGERRGGRIWWVHAAQTTNGRWACVCVCASARPCVCKRLFTAKACSLWGTDFYLWHNVTFASVTPAVLCVRPGFSSPLCSKMQMDLSAFFVQ